MPKHIIQVNNTSADSTGNVAVDIPIVTTVTGLRNITNPKASVVYQTTDNGGGNWFYDANDTTSVDNIATVIVTSGGKRFKRYFSGAINAEWYGLAADGVTDDRTTLVKILLTANSKIIFPPNKTILISSVINLSTLVNSTIDFNNCTFKIANGYSTTYLFHFVNNCANIKWTNFTIDGNKANVIPDFIAINIQDTSNLFMDNVSFVNCNKSALFIGVNTPNMYFGNVFLQNNYGNVSGNSQDIYISQGINSNAYFNRITSTRDTLAGGQVVYCNGNNTTINYVSITNCMYGLDYRQGRHNVGILIADGCGVPFKLVEDANAGSLTIDQYPDVTVDTIRSTNTKGDANSVCGILINFCRKLHINHLDLFFDETSPNLWYGVRFGSTATGNVHSVYMNRVHITGPSIAIMYFNSVSDKVKISDLVGVGKNGGGGYGLRMADCTDIVTIDNYSFPSGVAGVKLIASGTDNFVLRDSTKPLFGITNPVFTGPVTTTQLKLSNLNTAPASSTDTGGKGEIRVAADYIYVCTATNTWVRSPLTTF